MILEGLVTTQDPNGAVRFAPMGAIVDRKVTRLSFRPFVESRTFRNWQRTRFGVFHVTDDVRLLAQAAIGRVDPTPRLVPASVIEGHILADACRWYAFHVTCIHDDSLRASVECDIVGWGTNREFFGLNRAMFAVLEAAILATRVTLLDAEQIGQTMRELAPLVAKTGGQREQEAFSMLEQYLADQMRETK